jgi:hypothetical protein
MATATDEMLKFLDELRLSGVTNMFGATPYLEKEFPELTHEEARKVLTHWLETYSERHPRATGQDSGLETRQEQ